jgi:hypothetical protein
MKAFSQDLCNFPAKITNLEFSQIRLMESVNWQRCSDVHELQARWTEFEKQQSVYLHWGYHQLSKLSLEDSFRVIIHFDTHSCSIISPKNNRWMNIVFGMEDVMNFVQKCLMDYETELLHSIRVRGMLNFFFFSVVNI